MTIDNLPDWRDLQRRQHHRDLESGFAGRDRIDRLKHLALGLGRLGTQAILRGVDADLVANALRRTLSAANVLNLPLEGIAPEEAVRHGSRSNDLMDIAGRLCQAAEDIDHLADFHHVAVKAVRDLAGWCAGAAMDGGGFDQVVEMALAADEAKPAA